MDNKRYFLYKLIVKIIAILLLSIKVGFLYISYLIANILNISGFISILFIVIVWTCCNTLIDDILNNTIKKNLEGDEENEF